MYSYAQAVFEIHSYWLWVPRFKLDLGEKVEYTYGSFGGSTESSVVSQWRISMDWCAVCVEVHVTFQEEKV